MAPTNFSDGTAAALIEALHATEKLKCELRHSYMSNRRQESVAEHCWRAALLALIIEPYVGTSCNVSRVIELLLIHDLCEIYTGDIPIFDSEEACELKKAAEQDAVARLVTPLPVEVAKRIGALSEEYILQETVESRVAHVIDKLEAQLQHNEAPLDTWIEWEKRRVFNGFKAIGAFDNVLSSLRDVIVREATQKLQAGGEDLNQFTQTGHRGVI